MSHFIFHVSPVTCQMTPVTCHLSPTATVADPPPATSTNSHSRLVHQEEPKTQNLSNPQKLVCGIFLMDKNKMQEQGNVNTYIEHYQCVHVVSKWAITGSYGRR